jgi:hypothetical protein
LKEEGKMVYKNEREIRNLLMENRLFTKIWRPYFTIKEEKNTVKNAVI